MVPKFKLFEAIKTKEYFIIPVRLYTVCRIVPGFYRLGHREKNE